MVSAVVATTIGGLQSSLNALAAGSRRERDDTFQTTFRCTGRFRSVHVADTRHLIGIVRLERIRRPVARYRILRVRARDDESGLDYVAHECYLSD